MATYLLSAAELDKLRQVNRLLTEVTELHTVACPRMLCAARWRTDVQDSEEAAVVPNVLLYAEDPVP